ncbi:ATP-dependent Clp protease proteolytic subunit domain protein [Escherichia coli P0299438.5]|nr:ATP-dependent Clp protease proteolytic subunit domain protein [Escherichia coli P0299438.11]ENC02593.1 ATP-dependent Clp protease proteolytic subunit domain protein [Escherichia coli P0299438.3]ENC13777.1 ATP-dependent Clp protease proteolytic subunit domain protein [Escherichia coli P0299438.5]ENC19164.1 ATP-dependent Clp protease proteolytic subunit domain protein [Escherichia coli P0299438.6]ENC21181.1 ATP-dependent Clp protease proteolytic subunit domain protein [Escherichia coli P029943
MQAGHQSDADIYIYDEIGFWGVTAKQFISDLNALGDITVSVVSAPSGRS